MDTRYRCQSDDRRLLLKSPADAEGNPIEPTLNGIEYIEVVSPDQTTLHVHFFHHLPGASDPVPPPPSPRLTESNVIIEGGVRITAIRIEHVVTSTNVLRVFVDQSGDFSTYQLRLVASPGSDEPPAGFDPEFSHATFSFKVTCPSEFDCKTPVACPTEPQLEPEINYLAKDYSSFRRVILDRLGFLLPKWEDRQVGTVPMALVELLAYVGDQLSYWQDAIGTEAYLGTSRKRISVRRHARLLDYPMHDGCNARSWVHLEVEEGGGADGVTLPGPDLGRSQPGTRFITFVESSSAAVDLDHHDLIAIVQRGGMVFESMHDMTLHAAHNELAFYTWGNTQCCLPKGSTCATLSSAVGVSLLVGELLLFEEIISPTTGARADADPNHRHVVRLRTVRPTKDPLTNRPVIDIEWDEADALPFALCLNTVVKDEASGGTKLSAVSVARGNVVLADHGLTIVDDKPDGESSLRPREVPQQGLYRPMLRHSTLTFSKETRFDALRYRADPDHVPFEPAVVAMNQTPMEALPQIALHDGDETWTPKRDLFDSDRFRPDFVVEVESDDYAQLRFGDDELGKAPVPGSKFTATYRTGNGRRGNVGAEAIVRIATPMQGIRAVRNPLPAGSGADPETTEEVRQYAPQAFRVQKRAVTEEDWVRVAEAYAGVQRAAATIRWTGSWYTVFVTIDRKGGLKVDEAFERGVRAYLEEFRIAGYDLEVDGPVLVPLEIELTVCVKPGYFRSDIKSALLALFSRYDLPTGERGFFHPDRFTFGQPLYLSPVIEAAMNVAGVASVSFGRFIRRDESDPDPHRPGTKRNVDAGSIKAERLEVLRLDNDPSFPEHGRITFNLHGGL